MNELRKAKTSSRSDAVHYARDDDRHSTLCDRSAAWLESSGMAMGQVTCPVCLARAAKLS